MRLLSRAAVVVAASVLAVPLVPVSVSAATSATETGAYGGYFSSIGIRKPDASPANPPNLTQNADGVAPGNLAVSAAAGRDEKVSFIYFMLSDFEVGGTISGAKVTVPLAPSDGQNAQAAASPAKVRACPAGPEGFFGEDGAAIEDAPSYLCDAAQAPAELSADGKAYVFDIGEIAKLWATANDGLALVPAEGARTTPFQVVFGPAEEASLEYTFEAPADTGAGLGSGGAVSAPADSGTATFDDGFTADTGTTDAFATGSESIEAPLAAGELPAEAPAETAAEEPAVATEQVAAAGPLEALSPTPQFWLAALLLGGVLVFLSLVLGDRTATSAAAATKPTRLSRALSSGAGGGSLLTSRPSAS